MLAEREGVNIQMNFPRKDINLLGNESLLATAVPAGMCQRRGGSGPGTAPPAPKVLHFVYVDTALASSCKQCLGTGCTWGEFL